MTETVPKPGPGVGGRTANPRRWSILVLLCCMQFMLLLDDTVVNVALPSIRTDLGFSLAGLTWVVNAYVVAFGGFLLLGGRLADTLGRRRVFLIGTAVFAAASLANGLAQNPATLVASRAVQGLGGALAAPAALSMVAVLFTDPKERTRALGVWGALTGLGGATGVVLSGVLTDLVSWRWIFFVNLPVAALPLLLVPRLAPESRRAGVRRFDLLGAVTVTAGSSALSYGLLNTPEHGWRSARCLVALAAAAVLLAAFVVREATARDPLVPLGFFRRRRPMTANIAQILMSSANFGTFLLLTLYIQQVLAYSPMRAGLSYAGFFVGIFLGFGTAAPLVPRIGVRPIMVGGLGCIAAGMYWFANAPADGHYWANLFPGFVVMALGIAWSSFTINIAGVSDVPEREAGLASGVLNASQQLGGAIGLAVLVTLASDRTAGRLHSGTAPRLAQLDGIHLAFGVGGTVLVVGAVLTALLIGRLKPASVPPMVVLEDQDDVEVRN
ncbi:MFS transporter [Actinomadura napierensis]|uniref:DHA2 family efflux MFS transporter permease subunit n=1 Tax=Actinomadura napierensis TaxID=267854 RepID=A0ABN2ZYI4_9ACTN